MKTSEHAAAQQRRSVSKAKLLPLAASVLTTLTGAGAFAGAAYAGSYHGPRGRNHGSALIPGSSAATAEMSALSPVDAAANTNADDHLVVTAGADVVAPNAKTSHCVGDEITLTVTTLVDEPFNGSETIGNPDGSGLSLKEAVGLALVCAQDVQIRFHPSLAGGVIRRAQSGPLIPVSGGSAAGRLTIDGDINGNGRADIVLTMRQQVSGGAPSPGDNPNIGVLIPVGGGIIDPPDVAPVWPTDRLVNVQGANSHLQLRNLVVFDCPFHSMMFVNGALATLEIDNVLFTGNQPSVTYSYLFQVEGGAQLSVRNSAVVGNLDTFSFNGYYNAGAIEVINSTIALQGADYTYAFFRGGTFLANSIVLGQNLGGIEPSSHHNITSGAIADVLQMHGDGTPSFQLLADPGNLAIDGGDNVAASGMTTDLFGNPRFLDGNGDDLAIVDIGAFELQEAVIATYPVGGTVAELLGSGLVLRNNDGDDLPIAADGEFVFATELANGSTYAITVANQPTSPIQTCTVANGSGMVDGAAVTDVTVTCLNSPPIADAGGPYFGQEGIALTLDASGSTDLDGDIVSHVWDLDYDGVSFDADAAGVSPEVSFPDDGNYTIALRVTDSIGGFDIATTQVNVANVAPIVNAGPNQSVIEGELVELAPASFIDPGVFDTHDAAVDWGDGSGLQPAVVDQENMTISASHTYADDGIYNVFVLVHDGNHVGSGNLTVTVSDVTPPQVLMVGTLPDPGDGSLDEDAYSVATVDRLTLQFDDRMMTTGPGSAAAPGNFRLVADGGGGVGTTTCLGGVAPGDLVIDIDSSSHNGGSRITTLGLNGGSILPDGRYRLLACAGLTDTGGNALDGNGDGNGGDDFVRNFTIDRSPPTDPVLSSTSHSESVWRNDGLLEIEWSGALDALAGVAGYAIVFDGTSTTDPGTTVSIPHGIDPHHAGSTVADGSHWFHLRACDVLGNCGDALHLGPYLIDTVAPAAPALTSPSHEVDVWSRDPVLELSWSGASDDASGVAGYSIQLDSNSDTVPEPVADYPHDNDPHTLSESLPDGDNFWVHLRTCDLAGNCGDSLHLGPFRIDTTAPDLPATLGSPSHDAGSTSGNRLVEIEWSGSSDDGSGLAGFAWHWNQEPDWICDEQIDGGPATANTTSPLLDSGDWYFHLCVGDAVGNWSGNASLGPFGIDATAPRILSYGSVADTGDGVLEHGEEIDAGITQVLVRFDEAMEPASIAAESFRLLRPGLDGLFETTDCGPPSGDDESIEPLFALASDTRMQAAVGVIAERALEPGHYRMLACPTLTDAYGNALDGQDSGSPSPAWIDFSIIVSNLVTNPNLDFDIAGWQFVGDDAVMTHDPGDAGSAWSSGSLRILGQPTSGGRSWLASQCVPVPGDADEISAAIDVAQAGPTTETFIGYQLFAGAECAETPFAVELSEPIIGSSDDWVRMAVPVGGPSGGRSVLVTLSVQPEPSSQVDVRFDDIAVRGDWDRIFDDGFENGEDAKPGS